MASGSFQLKPFFFCTRLKDASLLYLPGKHLSKYPFPPLKYWSKVVMFFPVTFEVQRTSCFEIFEIILNMLIFLSSLFFRTQALRNHQPSRYYRCIGNESLLAETVTSTEYTDKDMQYILEIYC